MQVISLSDNYAYVRGEFRRMVHSGLLVRPELAGFRAAVTWMFLGLAKSDSCVLITTWFPGIASRDESNQASRMPRNMFRGSPAGGVGPACPRHDYYF